MNDPNRPENDHGGQGNQPPQQSGGGAPPYQHNGNGETGPDGSSNAASEHNQSPPGPSPQSAPRGDQGQQHEPSNAPTEGQVPNQPQEGGVYPPQGQQPYAAQQGAAQQGGPAQPSQGAAEQQPNSAATGTGPSSGRGPSGNGSSRSGPSSSSGPRRGTNRQQQPRSRAFIWLFILALTGAVGGMGYYGYQEFYLKEFANLRAKVEQLDPNELTEQLASKQEELLADWQKRAEEVEQRLNQAEDQTAKIADLEAEIADLEESLANMEGLDELRELRDQLDNDLMGRIDEALANVRDIEGLQGTSKRLNKLEGRLAELEEQQSGVSEPVEGRLNGVKDRISSLDQRVAEFGDRFTQLESRLSELSKVAERSEQTAQQLTTLTKRVDKLSENTQDPEVARNAAQDLISDLEQELGARINELSNKVASLANRTPGDEQTWIKAEAAHLVQIAQQRVHYQNDVQSALEALKSADSLYAQLGGAAVDEREAIGKAIDKLLEYSAPDLSGIQKRLVAQLEGIEQLPIRGESGQKVAANAASPDGEQPSGEGLDRAVSKLRQGLSSLVRIEREDQVQQYIPAEQRYFIRENLRMQLEGSILALNRGDQQMYKNNIERAQAWLERYFDGDAKSVAQAQQELKDIAQKNIVLDPPDIQSLLDPVKSF